MNCSECAYTQSCFHALKLCERIFPGTCKQGRAIPKRKAKEPGQTVPGTPSADQQLKEFSLDDFALKKDDPRIIAYERLTAVRDKEPFDLSEFTLTEEDIKNLHVSQNDDGAPHEEDPGVEIYTDELLQEIIQDEIRDAEENEPDQESIDAFDEALAREERHEEQKADRERKVQP